MRKLLVILLLMQCRELTAQELFVFTEPASNMAARGIGLRLDQQLMKDEHKGKDAYSYHLMPGIMWGASKKIMVHLTGYASNMNGKFAVDGSGLYVKYRFFSIDDVHSHFRMAAFWKYSINSSAIHEYALNLEGSNSGYEAGLVATQLINKVAFSAGGSFVHATDNVNEKFLFGDKLRNAANYSVSVGKLMLPKEYTSYRQVNMNMMLEFLGQTNLRNGFSFIDVAPSVQFIFNSRIRLDLGYRYPLVTKLLRYAAQGGLLRLEYNFYNVF